MFKFLALVLAFGFGSVATAADCDWSPKRTLRLISPAKSILKNPVDVQFSLAGDTLLARFNVRAKTLNAKPVLGPGEFPFQFDVVEVFVSVEGDARLPYFEFELTPLNQTLQVKILDPKKPFINGVDLGLRTSVERTAWGWIGHMEIPLLALGWKGDPAMVVGDALAVQGKRPNRSYWSAVLPAMRRPDFHQPKYFRPLLTCEAP